MSDLQRVGPVWGGTGTAPPFTAGLSGSQRVQDAHGRFMQAVQEGRVFSGGMGLTSISNATYTTGTLGATVTPVIGVYNPIGSNVNLVILQAALGLTMTALQATGAGPFVWASTISTAPVTTGNNPLNRRTLQPAGSAAKDITNVAPTGMTPNLTVRGASSLGGGSASNAAFLATAVGMQAQMSAFVENIDGAIWVPPGGVLALLATTTPVAHSAASMLLWEEVPALS